MIKDTGTEFNQNKIRTFPNKQNIPEIIHDQHIFPNI